MNLERVYFLASDNAELTGLLSTPENKTDEVIISIHGMQSNCLKKREDIIGRVATENDKAYFAFNNRGHDLMAYTKREEKGKTTMGGAAFEDIYESTHDIKGAIAKMIEMGYTKIHLQGHSLRMYEDNIYL